MHEHVRDNLKWLEEFGSKEMQPEQVSQINTARLLQNKSDGIHQRIDDHYIFYNGRKNAKSRRPILLHAAKVVRERGKMN